MRKGPTKEMAFLWGVWGGVWATRRSLHVMIKGKSIQAEGTARIKLPKREQARVRQAKSRVAWAKAGQLGGELHYLGLIWFPSVVGRLWAGVGCNGIPISSSLWKLWGEGWQHRRREAWRLGRKFAAVQAGDAGSSDFGGSGVGAAVVEMESSSRLSLCFGRGSWWVGCGVWEKEKDQE